MDLKQVYEAMGGDYVSVTSRLPKEESVAKFLRKFKDVNEFDSMLKAAEEKDYKTVFATSHTLKGVCANLSITKLCKSCTDVCEAVRHDDPTVDLDALIEVCKKDYADTIDAISQID